MTNHSGGRIPAPVRIQYVETLRGIACILLVSYHVIGDTSSNGLQLPAHDVFSFVNRTLVDVRMPLFSFISGFVFSAYAADLAALRGKIGAKVRRLLIPLAVVGSIHYWMQYVFAPQEQPPYYQLFFLSYEHFWYLQATFVLMLAVFLVTYWMKGDGTRAALVLLAPCAIVSVLFDRWDPDVFSSYKAIYLAPYFLVGYLISHSARLRWRMDWAAGTPRFVAAGGIALVLLFAIEWALVADLWPLDAPSRRAIGLVIGLSACLLLFLFRFKSRFLTFIGDKSYAIFLLHVIFTAGSRIILKDLVPDLGVPALFAAGVVAGVAGPILISWAALKNPLAALLLFGIKPSRGGRAERQPAYGN